MRLSYVIVTRNHRKRLLETLAKLPATTPLPSGSWETLVVDNASTDGTASAVRKRFPDVRLIECAENEGRPARNHAIRKAAGKYVVMLDDATHPAIGAIPLALNYLAKRSKVGALVARKLLSTGEVQAPALPTVILGGASIIRKSVLDQVGGLAPEFFRQAEEYDLSFRIWAAGYRIERFEDIVFLHHRDSAEPVSGFEHRMDLRNNLILVERYLPKTLRRGYRSDWARRYYARAAHSGHLAAAQGGLSEARVWAQREAAVGRKTLSTPVLESIFGLSAQSKIIAEWSATTGARNIVLGDYSKNLFATWRACHLAGLRVMAIADGRPEFDGLLYRGVPIISDTEASKLGLDGMILTNTNPAQIDTRLEQLRKVVAVPILRLWEPQYLRATDKAAA